MSETASGRSAIGVLVGAALVLMIVAVGALGWRLVTGDSPSTARRPWRTSAATFPTTRPG